jgi:hypothetical protein
MSVYGYGYGTNDGQNALDWDYYRYGTGGRPLDYPSHLPWPPTPNTNSGGDGGSPNPPPPIKGLASLDKSRDFGWDDAKNIAANNTLGPAGDMFGLGNYNAGNMIATVGGGLLGIASLPVSLALGYLGNQAWSDKYGKDGFWGSFWGDDKGTTSNNKDAGPKNMNPLGIPGAGRKLTSIADLQNGPNQFGPEGFNIQGGEGVTDPNGIYGDSSGLVNDPPAMDTFNPEDNFGYGGSQVDSSGNSANFDWSGGTHGDGSSGPDSSGGFGGFEDGTDASDMAAADQGYW